MPENIRKGRNRAIVLSFVEFICSLMSVVLYEVRRSRLVLAIIVLNVVMTVFGFKSKVELSYWGLVLHSAYTISIIGGFYIYIIIDYFMQ